MLGHNKPSFDAIVEESLLLGLHLIQRDALIRCIEDPRLSQRHRLLLAQIIQRTNDKTGVAYPGRARLAADMVFYTSDGHPRRYSAGTVANTISELIDFGYIVRDKRAPDGGGRALSHYAVTRPSKEDLMREINAYCAAIKGQPKKVFKVAENGSDVNPRGDVSNDVNPAADVSQLQVAEITPKVEKKASDVTPVVDVNNGDDVNPRGDVSLPDVTPVVRTVTNKKNNTSLFGDDPAPEGKRKVKKNRTQIPADWQPSLDLVEYVKAKWTATEAQIARQAELFANFHRSKGSLMADWAAAWRTWWGNGYHRIPLRKPDQPPLQDVEAQNRIDQMAAMFERARLLDEEEEARCRP